MRLWRDLNPRDRRALLLGLAVVALALGASLVVRPFLHARTELRDRLNEQRELLARELSLVAAAERLPADLDAATRTLVSVRGRLFQDRDPLAGTAALASLVGETARRQGVLLETIEPAAPEVANGDLVAVRIEVRGRADLEGLLRWVAALEGSGRLLRVDQLAVVRAAVGTRAGPGDIEILTVSATVRGYVLASAGPQVPAINVARGERPQ